MAKQSILWTVLPYGRVKDGEHAGRLRVSVVVAPRLIPEAADEQRLEAFPAFLNWPKTLATVKFSLKVGASEAALMPVSQADPSLWQKLFSKQTPVAGFQFMDMSQVNLRSYPVRNVLGFLRRHYGRLAVQASSNHPTLLPWRNAHPDLKGMLGELGTRTQKINFGDRSVEVALPGFSRFFGEGRAALEERLKRSVFSPGGVYRQPVPGIDAPEDGLPKPAGQSVLRVLPADWRDPQLNGADTDVMSQFASADEYAFYQADRFYRREPPSEEERRMRRPTFANIPPAPALPEYDFHRIVASYGDYAQLLRALGLLVDCILEDESAIESKLAAGNGIAHGQMKLVVGWADSLAVEDNTPRTAWTADKERFFTRPRGNDLTRGLLRLEHADDGWSVAKKHENGLFDLYQVDPDGASLKTVGFTLTAQNLLSSSLSLRQIDGEVTYTTGDKQPVAALRSGGLGVSRHDRAAQVALDAAVANLKNQAIEQGNGDGVVFFAEDVLRGYRVDVSPVPDPNSPGKWLSLCAREGNYRLIKTNKPLDLPPDEGHVSGASTTSTASEDVDPDDHYLHESLFRWTGWGLCTPRPGMFLRARQVEDTQLQAEEPSAKGEETDQGNGLAVEFKTPKGTLPRLRFGQLYRFRARVVDVAGNSLGQDDPSLGEFEQASDAVGYWRFEPIDPPVMMQRARHSEGESLERMVIRSNFNADTGSYLATPDFAAGIAQPASQDFEYTANNERHLVPPKASQQQCEYHGVFDPYFGDPLQIKEGYAIAAREAGTLFDSGPGTQIELVTPASLTGVATTASVPPALPSQDNPVGDRLSGGQYVVHREALLETPYLPDPASGGVALRAAPGHQIPGVNQEMVLGPSCVVRSAPNQELVLLVAHRKDWPYSQGFRLILAERQATLGELPCTETFVDDGRPLWDEDERTLTLFVAKGRIARLFYSSFAHRSLIGTFGIPHWASNAAERDFVMMMAVLGCSWMLTPFRHLTLVHATQQPVCLPELRDLSIHREPGAQHVDLLCRRVRLHGPSTGKFEIEAEWHEWVDDLGKDGPERIAHKGQLGEIMLAENHANEFLLSNAVQASRIADNDNPQGFNQPRERARPDRHELGDTRFRLVHYRVRATTRFREYLPPSLYDQQELVTRLGPVALGTDVILPADDDPGAPILIAQNGSKVQSLVPASAAPDDPRVLYVVPTFRWAHSSTANSATQQSTRHGNGLRVWLDRPWFSSGDGELLGVILFGDDKRFTDIPQAMQPLVTQWGLDPLWDTALPKSKTRITDFPARVHAEALKLQERPNDDFVQVVGHRVHWDTQRRLWYCDIELDPGSSYMPFVRLALVRYQPNALPGMRISKVVLAEFAQVLPRRSASVKRENNSITLTLNGRVPSFGPMKFPVDSEYQDISIVHGNHETGRNRVELVLQTRDPDIDSDLAWSDMKVLGSTIVGEGGEITGPGGILFTERAATAAQDRSVQPRAGTALRLASEVELQVVTVGARLPLDIIQPGLLLDPQMWSTKVSLPATGGKPARLLLREFERYYTDRSVPEKVGNSTYRRRVIEERLVYAAIFPLASSSLAG
jgi:hypothetical protein